MQIEDGFASRIERLHVYVSNPLRRHPLSGPYAATETSPKIPEPIMD